MHIPATVVATVLVALLTSPASAGTTHVSCYDLGDDGVCEAGDPVIVFERENDLTLAASEYDSPEHPHVGLVLDSMPLGYFTYGLFVSATGDIHIRGKARSQGYTAFSADSWEGTIFLDDHTGIRTGNSNSGSEHAIELSAQAVKIGNNVSINFTLPDTPEFIVFAEHSLEIGDNLRVILAGPYAYLDVETNGTSSIGRNLRISAPSGSVSLLDFGGDLVADHLKVLAHDVSLVGGDKIHLTLPSIRTKGEEDYVYMAADTAVELVSPHVHSSSVEYHPDPTIF